MRWGEGKEKEGNCKREKWNIKRGRKEEKLVR
jgi:hypothetical protein